MIVQHATRQDAIRWVMDNTDNVVFHSEDRTTVRIDARGTVALLTEMADGTFSWIAMRRLD